jgi:hypothetical protein
MATIYLHRLVRTEALWKRFGIDYKTGKGADKQRAGSNAGSTKRDAARSAGA